MSVTVLGIKLTLDGAQQVESGMKRVVTTTDDLGTSAKNVAGYMKGMLGPVLGGLSFAALAQQVVSVQREFDVLNSSLVTVTGSSGAAAKEFAWIREFAATTPFQLNEVTQAFVKMRALGLDANRDALASYGNTASAMGKSLDQMIEAVADASTGEFERLKEFGIKTRQQGDDVTFTFRGVTTTVRNSSDEIVAYLKKIGDVDFAGAMAERAKTLDGQLSNLEDSWKRLVLTMSQGGVGSALTNDAGRLSDTLNVAAEAMEKTKQAGGGMFAQLANGFGSLAGRATFGALASTAELFNAAVNAATGNVLGLSENISLLPDNLKPAAEQAQLLREKLKQAETEYAILQARSQKAPDNIYIKSELGELARYIEALKLAREEKDKFLGQAAGGGRGFVNPQTVPDILAADEKKAKAQQDAYAKLMEKFASPKEKLAAELAKQKELLGPLFTPDVEQRIRASFAQKGGAGGKKNEITARDLLGFDTATIKRELDETMAAFGNAMDIIDARHDAGQLSDAEYYQARVGMVQLQADAQVKALEDERARLKAVNLEGDERLQQTQRLADIEKELVVVRAKAATEVEVLGLKEETRLGNATKAYLEATAAAEQYLATLQLQYMREQAGVGKGAKARQFSAGLNQIDDRYEGQRQGLAGELRRGEITQADYDKQLALINDYQGKAEAAYRDHYNALDQMQGDWVNGMTEALANYRDQAMDVSGQTDKLFTDAFQGMEDALVTFVTTGKLSFTSLADSIVADITRMIIKQQMLNLLQSAMGMAGSGGVTGFIGSVVGAVLGGGSSASTAGSSIYSLSSGSSGLGLKPPSFDGGGFTGAGPRMGGVDGKGGFWSLLHPQETVVDHSKGQGLGGKSTHINVSVAMPANANRQTAQQFGRDVASQIALASRRNG